MNPGILGKLLDMFGSRQTETPGDAPSDQDEAAFEQELDESAEADPDVGG